MNLKDCLLRATTPFYSRKYIIYWCVIYIFAFLGIADFAYSDLINLPSPIIWLGIFMISALKSTIWVLLLWWTRRKRWMQTCVWMIVSLFCLLGLLNGVCYKLYGFGISNHLITVFAQTNVQEVKEFMPGLVDNLITIIKNPIVWIVITGVSVSIYLLSKYARGYIAGSLIYVFSIIGLGSLIYGFSTMSAGRTSILMMTRITKSIVYTVKERHQLEDMLSHVREFPEKDALESQRLADVCLIIGESASRDHLSIYGYPLNTSPKMQAKRDSLFIFTDAVASSTSTAQNMERLLSFMDDRETVRAWYEFPLLIDLFKNAGYKVWWLSNQERTGMWSNSTAAMVLNADKIVFKHESSEDHQLIMPDEILLSDIKQGINENVDCKLLGVHLMGSHTLYRTRYPDTFNYFNADSVLKRFRKPWLNQDKAQTVAEYDNSIRYTDFVVDSVINMVSQTKRPMLMLYVSDHGENVYDDRDFLGRDEKRVNVPFIIYLNSRFRQLYPDLTATIAASTHKAISTGDIIYMLMTVTGTSYPYYDASRDVLYDRFKTRQRYVNGKPWIYDHVK